MDATSDRVSAVLFSSWKVIRLIDSRQHDTRDSILHLLLAIWIVWTASAHCLQSTSHWEHLSYWAHATLQIVQVGERRGHTGRGSGASRVFRVMLISVSLTLLYRYGELPYSVCTLPLQLQSWAQCQHIWHNSAQYKGKNSERLYKGKLRWDGILLPPI